MAKAYYQGDKVFLYTTFEYIISDDNSDSNHGSDSNTGSSSDSNTSNNSYNRL